jgi:hypothetical protein
MSNDPIDQLRDELLGRDAAPAEQVDAQRARLDAAMRTAVVVPARRHPIRRWLPASGFAVAALAVAALVAVAVAPSDKSNNAARETSGLQLVKSLPRGAFAGIDLDTASASEVLHAAGRAAADSVPDPGPHDWTYTRLESTSHDFPTSTSDRWTSPDGERSFIVGTVNITSPTQGRVGRSYSVQYEYLKHEVIGNVIWQQRPDGTYERKASWSDDANDGSGDLARMVKLTDALRIAKSSSDVSRALYDSIADAKLRFQDGWACGTNPKYSSCGSSGFVPQAKGLTDAESKRLFLTGQLLTTMVSTVFPRQATRAIYDYLAALPEARVAPASDGSGDVILSLRVKGPSFSTHRLRSSGRGIGYETRVIPGTTYNEKAVAAIDPETGRLERVNPTPTMSDFTTRYVAFGVAPGPAVGGSICDDFPKACETARDLNDRLATDPDAKFAGVVDWMFISQFCDGMINRDGTPKAGDHMPLSASKDPKVKAERAACDPRVAAAAQAH